MIANYRVCLDACVLANHGVCDLLLRLAEAPPVFTPIFSEAILQEVYRVQTEKLPRPWTPDLASYFQSELWANFPDSFVTGHEALIPRLTNDEKDRHVLAAAIQGQSHLILTFNFRHFCDRDLAPWNLTAKHPQDYLIHLFEMAPVPVMARLQDSAIHHQQSLEARLRKLSKSIPRFCETIAEAMNSDL